MSENFQGLIIRKWEENDIDIVRNLVVELAIFEKEPAAVTATPQDYVAAFKSGLIAGHVAENNGKIVGMTLYYETFSTWKGKMLYLEDFIVKEEYRSLGIGQKLFDAYEADAKIRNCTTLKWQVLDWNKTAISFYEKNGADIQTEWWTCRKFTNTN